MGSLSLSAPSSASITSPAPRDVWDRLVASDPTSLPTQTGRWLDAVCSVAGLEDASRMYLSAKLSTTSSGWRPITSSACDRWRRYADLAVRE